MVNDSYSQFDDDNKMQYKHSHKHHKINGKTERAYVDKK